MASTTAILTSTPDTLLKFKILRLSKVEELTGRAGFQMCTLLLYGFRFFGASHFVK